MSRAGCSPGHPHPFQPWLCWAKHRVKIASSLKQQRPQSPFAFQTIIIRLTRFVWITLCPPDISGGRRKKATSQNTLAFFCNSE